MKILCDEKVLTIVRGAKLGDETSLERLIEYFTPSIKSKCCKYKINGLDFEDLFSEGVRTLLKCVDRYKFGQTNFTVYFFRALTNEFNYLLRKSYNDEVLSEKIYSPNERYEEVDVAEKLWKDEIKEVVRGYIMTLKEEEKAVVKEIFYREKTMAEVAREMELTFSKVQYIRNLFLRRIRENITGATM